MLQFLQFNCSKLVEMLRLDHFYSLNYFNGFFLSLFVAFFRFSFIHSSSYSHHSIFISRPNSSTFQPFHLSSQTKSDQYMHPGTTFKTFLLLRDFLLTFSDTLSN